MAANTVTLVDEHGNVIKSTDNGDGTATLTTGGSSVSSAVKIVDSAGTNQATVSAAGAQKVDGSAVTQPVSAAALPLPSGAATAAKQPVLGTAGTASTDVLSVQGIASMTALKVDGSAITQPVSAASLPLPSGAATAARQAIPSSAGAASAEVLSVQGVASMTPLAVTASAGTNLNTSALALDATLTGGTQQTKLTDGTNIAHILKADGTAAGQNSQLVAGGHLATAFTTATVQAVATVDGANYAWVSVQITSQGGSSTVAFQASNDGSTWVAYSLGPTTGGAPVSSTTGTSFWHGPLLSRYFRLNVTGIVSGTTAGTVEVFAAPRALLGANAVQTGTWTVQPGNTANTTPWLMTPAAGTTGGYSFSNITTATTTVVKSGAGTLHALVINTKGVASTATIYDNTAASGTKIGTVDTSLGTGTIVYDVAFATGLTIVTAATADITAVYK